MADSGAYTNQMVSSLKTSKNKTMRADPLRPLAWFLVFVLCESPVIRFSRAQSKETTHTPPGCADSGHSLLLADPTAIDLEAGKDAEQHFVQGLQLKSAGDNARAESEFKTALADNPEEGRYVRELAYLYIGGKRDDDAVRLIQKYTHLCGDTALAYSLAGELLFQRKQFDAARLAIAKSLKLSDQSPRMHELLGLTYLSKNGAEALSTALSDLQRAEELDPNDAEIRYFYGRILYGKARYAEAREQFLACLKLQPGYRKALENLGLCREALGDFTQATEDYKMAIELEEAQRGPKHGEPFGYYGAMLTRMGKWEEALQILRKGIAASPKSFVVNYELGRVLLTLGQPEEAEHYLLIAEQLAPAYPRTYYLLGKIHQKQRRADEAKQDFAKFEQLNKGAENIGFPVTDREGEPR